MKKFTVYLSVFCVFVLLQSLSAQTFTKITIGSVVTDSSNSPDVSWGDYDNDGDLDLFVTTTFPSVSNIQCRNFLFQNNCNGQFTRVVAIPGGIATDGPSFQCVWIDYNNDDNLDLYVTNRANLNNYLYKNNGDGTFTKITTEPLVNDSSFSHGIGWADYDNDGHLDLFFANFSFQKNKLYHNNGDGTFNEITTGDIVNDARTSSGAAWADYDNDGDMDLYVTTKWSYGYDYNVKNYNNFFYINKGDGTFTKDTTSVIVDNPDITLWYRNVNHGCSWADYNNDLNLDLLVTAVYGGDYLYKNNGDGTFTSITEGPIVNTYGNKEGGSNWGDFDNDGDLDLFVSTYYENYFYINNGDGSFTRNTDEIIASDTSVESYGAAWADYDNDGDLDLFVPNAYGAPNNFLYLNIYSNNGNSNHWLKVRCKGTITNRSAIGARVYAKAKINSNDIWQMREIKKNYGLRKQ